MIKGGKGGGNTYSGAKYEEEVDITLFISKINNYKIDEGKFGKDIYYKNELIGHSFKKHNLYKYLDSMKIDWKAIVDSRKLPDDVIYILTKNKMHIIEIKSQVIAGSVDEKLNGCEFLKIYYQKLLKPLNVEVELIYILNDWFCDSKYKSSLEFILEKNCSYFINKIPLNKFGLPTAEDITIFE